MFSRIGQRYQEYSKSTPENRRPFGIKRVIIFAGIIAIIVLIAAAIIALY